MRRVVVAALTALVPCLSVVGVAAPAGSVGAPVFVHHSVGMSTVLTGPLPGRPGDFHQVRLAAGTTDLDRPVPEAAGPVSVQIADFSCPTGFTATQFLTRQASCSRVGSTEATGEALPFVDDVVGQSFTVRADLQTAQGHPVPVDVDLSVLRATDAETQVVADSSYTWKVENSLGGPARATGSVGNVSLVNVDWTASSAYADWDRFTARPWRADRGVPQELGWSLDGRVSTRADALISKVGWMPGRHGNLHVASWHVDADDYESILEPVVDYRCGDPTSADAGDPVGSGCRQVGEGAGYNWSLRSDITVGSKLVVRIPEGDVTRLRFSGSPTVTVNATSQSVLVSGECSIGGAHTWSDIGRLYFGSANVRVDSCQLRQGAHYDAG